MGNFYSDHFIQAEGVPQGSLLSVTLFIIHLSQILNYLPSYVHGNLYVHDLQISCQVKSTDSEKNTPVPPSDKLLNIQIVSNTSPTIPSTYSSLKNSSISEKTKIKKTRDHKKSTKKSNQLAQAKESKEGKRVRILAAKRDPSSLGDGPLSREDFLKDSFKRNNTDDKDDSDTLKVHPSEESNMSTSEVDDLSLSS
ncbi:hypothetical protein AVEN_259137-1 [Araneus ventricosus]|uniref:Reverse transcriptase domain-containing protein n=1 Tax=Araneus ventricosus TaxID=182803 RepID=A0A4Y2D961_ARAVE|nr:hypothetical protein AVEN_259137-1 [Araneus ventricosus]